MSKAVGGKIVLIVEDQAEIRKLLRMTLDIIGAEVHEADSGESGIRMAGALRPDAILMDVMMPGKIDGYQACHMIKTHPTLKDTPVILVTARGQEADVLVGDSVGADAYLIKPFSPLQLLDTVNDLVDKRNIQPN